MKGYKGKSVQKGCLESDMVYKCMYANGICLKAKMQEGMLGFKCGFIMGITETGWNVENQWDAGIPGYTVRCIERTGRNKIRHRIRYSGKVRTLNFCLESLGGGGGMGGWILDLTNIRIVRTSIYLQTRMLRRL